MATRSSSKLTLRMGMVLCPVKLFTASDEKSVRFRTLHRECGKPVNMPAYCRTCEKQVGDGETVKGFEVAKEQFVQIEEAEMDALPLPTAKVIEIVEFIDGKTLDPRMPHKSYFCAPEDVGKKPFALVLSAMEKTGLVAIAKVALSSRERLVALAPYRGLLLVQVLHWADEMKDAAEFKVELPALSDKEMGLGVALVEAMKGTGDLSAHKDGYREAVLALVQAKQEGKTVEAPKPIEQPQEDLAAALMASIEARKAAA